ncbi:hypothetical protein B7494_g299 [Chlorociboria aeruginascens]|nr:hypothetical protein B7494_g299 [Chlorociboria aeruginascens]
MQNRLKHLEGLVKGAMSGQIPMESESLGSNSLSSTNFPTTVRLQTHNSINSGGSEAISGKLLIDENETTYVGATHWAAILEDIEEVKSYFTEELGEAEDYSPSIALTFDVGSPATRLELLAALPSRLVLDRLVSRYFNSNSPAMNVFHGPTFQKEYQGFLVSPDNTPTAWLALLYAIMVIATFSALSAGDQNLDDRGSPMEMIQSYRQCCVQALIISHYTKPGPYTLEALMIYLEGDFLLSSAEEIHCYLLAGMVIRLALRMGLHRDSTKFGGQISPFHAEMRRRAWHHLVQIDMLGSFHIGLPSMTHPIDSDTLNPRNLMNEDLDENMAALPPSRPETELTPISYMICKSRLCVVASKIAALANLLSLPVYAEVLRLDSLLIEAHNKVPPFFQLPSSGISVTDPPERIVKRISIELLFQKSRCMLHRKYLAKEKEDLEYTFSKEAGLDAALKLLRVQCIAHEASLPGGILGRDRWFLSSLSIHDFLLAAMIVYLSIIQGIGGKGGHATENSLTPGQQRAVAALEESHRIWIRSGSSRVEAKRAAVVLEIMLKKVYVALGRNAHIMAVGPWENYEDSPSSILSNLTINVAEAYPSVPDGPNTLVTAATSNTTPSSGFDMPFDMDLTFTPTKLSEGMPPLSDDFNWARDMTIVPDDFNWGMFDSQIQPQQVNEQTWSDFTEAFKAGNEHYFNTDLI